jgi:hypothetical protein
MNNRIHQVIEVLKKEKWFLIIMFISFFAYFYFLGNHARILASGWIWTKDFEEAYPHSPDIERIEYLTRMMLRGDGARVFATLWVFSPVLFSVLCTLGIINLTYAVKEKNKQGKKHFAEYIMVVLSCIVVTTYLYNKFFVWG